MRVRVKSFEDVRLEVVWIPGTITIISVCSLRVPQRKIARLLRVVTVCSAASFKNSGSKSPDGEGGCNIRAEHRARTNSLPPNHPGAGIPCRAYGEGAEPGKALSRYVGGRVDSKGAGAELFIREPRGSDKSEQLQSERSDFSTSGRTATHSLPAQPRQDISPSVRHGSHLDPVRCQSQECQCEMQSAGHAPRGQRGLVVISGESFQRLFNRFFWSVPFERLLSRFVWCCGLIQTHPRLLRAQPIRCRGIVVVEGNLLRPHTTPDRLPPADRRAEISVLIPLWRAAGLSSCAEVLPDH